jgi:hypothetical protein
MKAMHALLAAFALLAFQAHNTPAELALIDAIKKGSALGAEKAIAAGASVNARVVAKSVPSLAEGKEGGEPYLAEPVLTLAVVRERIEIAKILLRKGADPNQKDEGGWTPLMHGARSERPFVSRQGTGGLVRSRTANL